MLRDSAKKYRNTFKNWNNQIVIGANTCVYRTILLLLLLVEGSRTPAAHTIRTTPSDGSKVITEYIISAVNLRDNL